MTTFAALFSVLKARWLLLACAIGVGFVTSLTLGVIIPKTYRSSAVVQVDGIQENLLTGLFEPRVRVSEFLGQQAAIAGSRTVAVDVFDRLVEEGYISESEFEEEWRAQTGGELSGGVDLRLWASDELLKKLEIGANANESTLEIIFASAEPRDASRIANAFADAYMKAVLDRRQRRAARNAENFSEETRALENEIEIAQRDLTDFREFSGIVGLGAQRLEDIEVELATITMRLAEARTDFFEMQSLMRQASEADDGELLTLPLPADAQAGRQAQTRLGAVQVQVQRLGERYGPTYPPFIEARNEKRALENTIMQAVIERVEFSERRMRTLENEARVKKADVVALQETKQTYDVLSKRVDASRNTYDLVAQRSLQESLQSRVDVVDVFMLARAVPAEKPSTPGLALVVLLGVVAGGMLGASAAVCAELIEGRIRTNEAVAKAFRAPVLAEIGLPDDEDIRRAA